MLAKGVEAVVLGACACAATPHAAAACGLGEVQTWHRTAVGASSPSLVKRCASEAQRRLSGVPVCGGGAFAVLTPVGHLGHMHYVCKEGIAPPAPTAAPTAAAWPACKPGFCDRLLTQFQPRLVWGCRPCAPKPVAAAAHAAKATPAVRVVAPKINCAKGLYAKHGLVETGATNKMRIGWYCSARRPIPLPSKPKVVAHVPCPDGWVQHPTATGSNSLIEHVIFGTTSSGLVCVPFAPGHNSCPKGYRKFVKAKVYGNTRKVVTFCREIAMSP